MERPNFALLDVSRPEVARLMPPWFRRVMPSSTVPDRIPKSQPVIMGEHTAYEFFKDFAGPLAAVIAAVVAALITFRFSSKQTEIAQFQADIASDKLKFDLFERRVNTYDAIREVIGEIVRHDVVTNQSINAFVRAIKSYLDDLHKTLLQHQAVGMTIESLPDPQRNNAIDVQGRRFEKISNFYIEFPKLLAPYVKMRR